MVTLLSRLYYNMDDNGIGARLNYDAKKFNDVKMDNVIQEMVQYYHIPQSENHSIVYEPFLPLDINI